MKRSLPSSLAKETFISKLDFRFWLVIIIFRFIRMLFRSFPYGKILFIFWILKYEFRNIRFLERSQIKFCYGAIANRDSCGNFLYRDESIDLQSAVSLSMWTNTYWKQQSFAYLWFPNAINRVSKDQPNLYVTVYSRIFADRVCNIFNSRFKK